MLHLEANATNDKVLKDEGFKEDRQTLFQSDHTTEDGMDLLPVDRLET